MTLIFDEKMNALSDVLRELNSLEPDDIAKLLNSEGIKGKARECSACPMAEYLNKKLEGEYFVTLNHVYFYDPVTENFDDDHPATTPPAVRSFIRGFDQGRYLFLDAGRPIE